MSETNAQQEKAGGVSLGCLLVPLLLLGACGVVLVSGALSGDDDSSPSVERVDAERVCEDFVEDRLRSPGSADFSDVTATGGGGSYTVSGDVDSDNAFGASIRNTFVCRVRLDAGTWRLQELTGLVN